MSTEDQIQTWFEWTREYLRAAEEIPNVNALDKPVPWTDDLGLIVTEYAGCPSKLLQLFTDALATKPLDVPARFTALHVFHSFKNHDVPVEDLAFQLLGELTEEMEDEGGQGNIEDVAFERADALLNRIGRGLLGWSPGLRQPVKTLPAVRWNLIVQRRRCPARWRSAGEAEVGNAGEQAAKE